MTIEELTLVSQIATRARQLYERLGVGRRQEHLIAAEVMDVHQRICPLRLQDLLESHDLDFAHDVYGIHDMYAGGGPGFRPRHAAPPGAGPADLAGCSPAPQLPQEGNMTDYSTMTGGQLAAHYNNLVTRATQLGLTAREVNRFKDHASGVSRITQIESSIRAGESAARAAEAQPIPGRADPVPVEVTRTEQEDEMAKKDNKVKKEAKAPKAPRANGGETLTQQMARYNALAERAIRQKVPGVRILGKNGSTFASRALGDRAIERVTAALGK